MSEIRVIYQMDFIRAWLVLLTLWLSVIICLVSQKILFDKNYIMRFLYVVLFLCINLVNTFLVNNILIFYFLFELSLIPTLILIIGWGYQPERLEAGIYIIIYTISASLPLFIIILFLFKKEGFVFINIGYLNSVIYFPFIEFWWFFIVFAFIVKIPIYLTHLWLPKAHVEAPVSGSIILAGVLLKLGGYGVSRFSFIFPYTSSYLCTLFLSISLWGAFITSIICVRQSDIKSLIAYSSVGHIGLLIGGLFTNFFIGWQGVLVIMISHGIVSAGLFSLVNIIYEKVSSRRIFLIKGVLTITPVFSLLIFLLCILNIGCPPSINLLGEVILYIRVLSWSIMCYIFVFIIVFLRALYSLYLYSSVQHGVKSIFIRNLRLLNDLNKSLIVLQISPAFIFILLSGSIIV